MSHRASIRHHRLRFAIAILGITRCGSEIAVLSDRAALVTRLCTHRKMVEELVCHISVDAPFVFRLVLVVVINGSEGVE